MKKMKRRGGPPWRVAAFALPCDEAGVPQPLP